MELVNSTMTRGSRCSLGREISPMPFFSKVAALSGRKLPLSSTKSILGSEKNDLFSHAPSSCATFSSSVMRDSRSATRCSTGSFASRYGGVASCAVATRDFHAKAPATANNTPTHAQNREKKPIRGSIQDFYACNPKSAWYDTTTVNVHGNGFLQLFRPFRRAWQGVPRFFG